MMFLINESLERTFSLYIFKLRIKRLMKRWKHSGGNVINAGEVNLVSTCCRYQTRHNSMN